ncbi:MAG: hypothetical protein WBE13_07220 [Candidatus Acidiferrum sp.]
MPISVTPDYLPSRIQEADGRFFRRVVLAVTGLTAGAANTIAHGLTKSEGGPATPQRVRLNPGAAGLWSTTQVADATNIYVTVGAGGATSGWINVEY